MRRLEAEVILEKAFRSASEEPKIKAEMERYLTHSQRVGEIINELYPFAAEKGLLPKDESYREDFVIGALYHDYGKPFTKPLNIWVLNGSATAEEVLLREQHTIIGAKEAKKLNFTARQLELVIDSIHYHHKTRDSNSYPKEFSGKNVPVIAQWARLVDIYHSMRTRNINGNIVRDKPYGPEEAIDKISLVCDTTSPIFSAFDHYVRNLKQHYKHN